MRIVLVIGALSFGGAERVMVNLANYLVNENEVLLCTMFERPSPFSLDPRVTLIQGLAEEGKVKSLKKLRKIVLNYKADVVLSFLTQINISTIVALLGTSIPVVVSERNDPAFEPSQLHRKILRRLVFPFAKGFVFQTDEAKKYFGKRIGKRSVVIPNPVFINEEIAIEPFLARNEEFVAIGRLTLQKNYSLMIDAFSAAVDKRPELILKIYGDGELKESLQREIQEHDKENSIFLMGTSTDVHNKIKKSRGFLLSSNHEGMPNVLLEAMALGLCCISTDCPCGGPREIIKNGKNGILVPTEDKNALADAIVNVATNCDLAKKLSENASKVREEYSLTIIGERWVEYLKQIAKV